MSVLRSTLPALAALSLLLVTGCPKKDQPQAEERLTGAEARDALVESAAADQAMKLTGGAIEITTDFTIGKAAEAAATELATFYESQLPCAAIDVAGASITVTYGANAPGGTCLYRGQTYSGVHTVTIRRNEESDVVVEHTWDRLSNGQVEVSGDAEVTWTLDDPSRRVVHELRWTSLLDGREGEGDGDRVQRPLSGGIAEGFSVDGARSWRGASGAWQLDIDAVEMRWIDPIPQAGRYGLETPDGKQIDLLFRRLDDDTIRATLSSGTLSFDFDVTRAGAVAEGS